MNKNIVVSICCLAYNHAPYIRQCLNGFMMQKTNFPFEVLIHDDASTDGTADIIREYEAKYPNMIKPIYQTENQYLKGVKISATFNFPRAKGKYIALCEGDDYWTDPYKLQKQVDFLEENDDFAICAHNAFNKREETLNYTFFNQYLNTSEYNFEDIVRKDWFIPTASIVFRKSEYYKHNITKTFYNGDYFLQLLLLCDGKNLYYMNDIMSVYRRHIGGISNSISSRECTDRIIELLNYMNIYTDYKHKSVIHEKIDLLNKMEQINAEYLRERKHEATSFYKLKYFILRAVKKLLCLHSPKIVFKRKYCCEDETSAM